MADLLPNIKWYKTTSGKVGIAAAILLAAGGAYLLYRNSNKSNAAGELERPPAAPPELPNVPNDYRPDNLPEAGKGCGTVITTLGTKVDYVKCNGIWYSTEKNNINWKSLAGNKTAIELLNNKYPS